MRFMIPVAGCLVTLASLNLVSLNVGYAQDSPLNLDQNFIYESEPRPTPVIQQVGNPTDAPIPQATTADGPLPGAPILDPPTADPGVPRTFSRGELSEPRSGSANVTTLQGRPREESPIPHAIGSARTASSKRMLIMRETQRANARVYRIQLRKAHNFSPLRPNIGSGHHSIDLNTANNYYWNGLRVSY